MIRILARAKINLALTVIGRRPDGYHDLETVLQSVTLGDEVEMKHAEVTTSEVVWAPGLGGPLPEQPDISVRVVEAAQARLAEFRPHAIKVVKRIPIGAGLGGGSADAAATLLGMAALHHRALPHGLVDEIAAQVGADVPFCMKGGLAVGLGTGTQLTDLRFGRTMWWVLGIPNVRLSTSEVYARFDETGPSAGRSIEPLAAALAGGDVERIASCLHNDLEEAAFDLAPQLEGLKEAMLEAGAVGSVMSGSGAAFVGLCTDPIHARKVAVRAINAFPRTEVVASARTGTEMLSRG
jgi:4-diphosphocytidyl-2-C-methyl-D-erythritol kinase